MLSISPVSSTRFYQFHYSNCVSLEHFSHTRTEMILDIILSDVTVCRSVLRSLCIAEFDQILIKQDPRAQPCFRAFHSSWIWLASSPYSPILSLDLNLFSFRSIWSHLVFPESYLTVENFKLSSFITENSSFKSTFDFTITTPINSVTSFILHIDWFSKHLLSFNSLWVMC